MLATSPIPILVNAQWLNDNRHLDTVKILDATSHLPTLGRNANDEHIART